jgi:hypothetical protein
MTSKKSGDRWFPKKIQMQGAQKLRSEAHLQVRRNDEVEAQRSRWTFSETIELIFSKPSVNQRPESPQGFLRVFPVGLYGYERAVSRSQGH